MKLLILLVTLLSISNVFGDVTLPCRYVTKDNVTIDFSGLNLQNGYYTYNTSTTDYIFNICNEASYCTTETADTASSICTVQGSQLYSFGDFSRSLGFNELPGGGIGAQLVYPGDKAKTCTGGQYGTRYAFLNLECANVDKLQVLNIVEPWDGGVACQLTVNMKVPCPGVKLPSSGGIGGGWVFIIILLSSTFVYIVAGSIINWKVRDQHGAEIFPNVNFWKGFGSLIKDGVLFIKCKITGTPGGDYSRI